ncbi:MAG: cytochrome c oxidase accessory protein CcoG [Pseudomonadota bacterium]
MTTADAGSQGEKVELYAARKKVYPQAIKGRFRTIKWTIMAFALGVYYLLPFVRWDRGPHAPDQAVLVDLPGRRAYFFFIEIWPQEVYYLTGLLVIAAMTLFLMNAVAGRLWCGYLCPQTVWTDLFYAVERLFEGDRRDRMKLDKEKWSLRKFGEKAGKHTVWLLIAWWTGGAWVLYFHDAPTLVYELATFQAGAGWYIAIGVLTATTYVFAGHMREQICVYACPWPRIQAALTDEWALNVTYRHDRGEPHMSLKHAERAIAAGEPAGDCINCFQCVAVCPTGIDIRDGDQLECIQCGLCIDACDRVMEDIGRPTGLIAYDTEMNIERRQKGEASIYKMIRARTLIYPAIIALVAAIMLFALVTRQTESIAVIHDRNPLFVELSDGSIRNGFTARLLNKQLETRRFIVTVHGIEGLLIEAVGVSTYVDGGPLVEVGPDTTREVRLLVFAPLGADLDETVPITFTITEPDTGATDSVADNFKAPPR